MQMAENYAYKHCDKCVSLLPNSKEYMVAHGLTPDKYVNIQNGVVLEEWADPEPIPEEHRKFFEEHSGCFIVGYFGGHALSNALDVILDTAKQCDDKSVVFVLAGNGVERNRLIRRKTDEQIENVFFLPPVNKKAIPSLVSKFDCVIITGISSPLYRFGLCLNKIYDSMMAGKPIICAIPAKDTLIEQYDCGIQIHDGNANNICAAIQEIREMPEADRNDMGMRGRRAIQHYFTYDKLAAEFALLFN